MIKFMEKMSKINNLSQMNNKLQFKQLILIRIINI